MRQRHLLGLSPRGFHRLAYSEWGDPDNPRVLVCVHGLTRNGRDFDDLAAALCDRFRVLCPDIAGRGRSQWLADPGDYHYPQYCADMAALIARAGVDQVHWLGTSMGGLIGMLLAAQPGSPVCSLVMNDIGPHIPRAALERIAAYVGLAPVFADLESMERHVREVAAPFGPLSDAQWRRLTENVAMPADGGGWALAYDPAIAVNVKAAAADHVDLWALWDAVRCPTLVLRAERSDLLTAECAWEMGRRGPRAQVVEIPRVGHAPTLMDAGQIAVVADFLCGSGA